MTRIKGHRRPLLRMTRGKLAGVAGVVAVAATVAAVAQAGELTGGAHSGAPPLSAPGALQGDFTAAAAEFHVPRGVLLAVAYQQTRWDTHGGLPSATGNYNVMGLTQVTAADVRQPAAAGRSAELNLRGDGAGPAAGRAFHPSAAALSDVDRVRAGDPALHTLDAAAALLGEPAARLRTDPRDSVRGGAALLAHYERAAHGSLPTDPAQWYAAVARFSQSPDAAGAGQFAGRVFTTLRQGGTRWTDDGQLVTLTADPAATVPGTDVTHLAATYRAPAAPGTATASARRPAQAAQAAATPAPECPSGLTCNFKAAAYQLTDPQDPTSYGNYDIANRPDDGDAIKYIVIHDTESSYDSALSEFQDASSYASAHYLIRSGDGLVTQMVPDKDIAWHAGNKYVNMHSIGIEHEGYAVKGASWYTTSEYESSAALVKYLAAKYGVPLDRQHVIGHDDVPGPIDDTASYPYVSGMHWDPGTFWDWNYYLSLLGVPVTGYVAGSPLVKGEHVRLAVPFTSVNEPKTTQCPSCAAIPAQPANFVYLHTSPSGPLLSDPYVHSSGAEGTTVVSDWGDKLVAGEDFVVAGVSGDWTQVWYEGRGAWFWNPRGSYTQPVTGGPMKLVTPAAGKATVPVWGRAYPDASAYPSTVDAQPVTALTKYAMTAGQEYVTSGVPETGDFYNTVNINGDGTGDRVLVTGTTQYYPIRYNHRLAYVRTSDVTFVNSTSTPATATRADLVARDSAGRLWQYQGTGSATASAALLSKYGVESGFQGYRGITPLTPLRPNGTGDLLARDSSGTLWYYKGGGHASTPFPSRVKAGTGWGSYALVAAPGDVTGDGRPDVFAMDGKTLYLYVGTGSATTPLAARVKVGTGYGPYNAMTGTGDLTGDGRGDFVARDFAGRLYLYAGTGVAAKPLAGRVRIGDGFQSYDMLAGPGDLTGDGRPDLVARDSSGTLWVLPGTGVAAAPFGAREEIGTGWSGYNLIF